MHKQHLLSVYFFRQSLLPLLLVVLLALTTSSQVHAAKVNVNSADAKELATLPYVGKIKAKAIIEYRKKFGPFRNLNDLGKVSGIGKKTLEQLEGKISFGQQQGKAKKDQVSTKSKAGKINLNKASVKELQSLPGIGKAKAQNIVKARKKKGGFTSLDELTEIKGINEKVLQRLKPLVTLGKK